MRVQLRWNSFRGAKGISSVFREVRQTLTGNDARRNLDRFTVLPECKRRSLVASRIQAEANGQTQIVITANRLIERRYPPPASSSILNNKHSIRAPRIPDNALVRMSNVERLVHVEEEYFLSSPSYRSPLSYIPRSLSASPLPPPRKSQFLHTLIGSLPYTRRVSSYIAPLSPSFTYFLLRRAVVSTWSPPRSIMLQSPVISYLDRLASHVVLATPCAVTRQRHIPTLSQCQR